MIGKDVQAALTPAPYNFLPVNKDVPLTARHADEEPRRDGQVHQPRLGQDQPAARGWIEKFNKDMAK